MDKNKNVDSQNNKVVTVVDLREKLKSRLDKSAKSEAAEPAAQTNELKQKNAIPHPVESDELAVSYQTDVNNELDIEELMKKYLPEADLKYAHPMDIAITDEEPDETISASDSKIEKTVPKKIQTEPINDTAYTGFDKNAEDINCRKHQIDNASEYYLDGKVSDEYVGNENIYETLDENQKFDEHEQIEKITENEIFNLKNRHGPVRRIHEAIDQTEDKITNETEKLQPVQREQLDLLSDKKQTDLKEHSGVVPDTTSAGNEIDETDVKLMMAFGMDDELEKTVGFDRINEVEEKLDRKKIDFDEVERIKSKEKKEIEFIDFSQVKEIVKKYKTGYSSLLLRIMIGIIVTAIAFLYENITVFGGSLPPAMDILVYPVVHIMIDLQLLLIGSALVYRQVINGTVALFKFKTIPESITAVILSISILYQIAVCFFPSESGFRMYSFPVLLCVLSTLIFEFLNLKREIFSFNIVASKRPKFTFVKSSNEDANLETEAFGQLLPENSNILKINKTMFVNSFMKRMHGSATHNVFFGTTVIILLMVSLIFFVMGYVYSGDIYASVSLAYITLLISMPFSAFITFSYPFFKASKEAYAVDSAILGESSLAEYSGVNAISFDDKDVFPSYGVKVKSVKVFGENRIDVIIYNAASLFLKTGGPLADVFDIATRDLGHSENVDIIKVDTNGIEAVIEGSHIFIGKAHFIKSKGFYLKTDPNENESDITGENSVMFMTLNNELAAKMYVQYVIDPDFEYVIKQLSKIGICVGIKTFDPNIDDQMLSTKIKISKYPVKILKCKSTADVNELYERIESGIVSKNSAKALLQTLSLCDKVINVIKNNMIVKIFSIVISVILAVIIMILGMSTSIVSLFIALYQIFWMVPMIIISRIFIRKI